MVVSVRFGLVAAATLATTTLASASVTPFNTHWGVSVGEVGQLVTEQWQGGVGYLGESRVFAFNAQPFGDGQFFDIGTNSVGGTFATPGSIGFDFLGPLMRWTGSGFEAAGSTMTFQFGPLAATSGDGPVAGFGTLVRDETTHPSAPGQWGRHHTHHNVFIDDPDAPAGVYMMSFQLWYAAGAGNPVAYDASLPFWTVFNLGGSTDDVVEAMAWIEANLVPGPGAVALLAVTGLVGAGRRRRA